VFVTVAKSSSRRVLPFSFHSCVRFLLPRLVCVCWRQKGTVCLAPVFFGSSVSLRAFFCCLFFLLLLLRLVLVFLFFLVVVSFTFILFRLTTTTTVTSFLLSFLTFLTLPNSTNYSSQPTSRPVHIPNKYPTYDFAKFVDSFAPTIHWIW
jgi:hypothetical protein